MSLDKQRTAALAYASEHFPQTVESLKELVRIGGISAERAPSAELERSATAVSRWMERIGLERVEVLRLPNVHPYVYAEWLGAPGAPTALIYAHHDVQPTGRPDKWLSPPFEPAERQGRLYGRGVVDDKAGAAIHFAAIEAYLHSGGLPINLKVIIDGEEEIGSANLAQLLSAYRSRLDADIIVLTDTANLATGVPSITYALRGLVIVNVEVSAIDHPLHSGMWGGPVPDSAMALCQILGRLVAPDGTIAIPGLYDDVRPMSDDERARTKELPFDLATFRQETGMLSGVRLAGEPGFTPYELMWRRPSLAITAMEAAPLKGAANQILPSARARVGIRTVPDMDGNKVGRLLEAELSRDPPWGVQVKTELVTVGPWWMTRPEGAAFAAAERALAAGYGRPATYIGCGGTIPFVDPFSHVLGGAPALLLGLEDPACNAHSENESLHLGDFEKGIRTAIHLYAELASLQPAR